MLSKIRSDDAQDDERRLFPSYESGSNAVRITPGATFKKPGKSSLTHGFSPYRPVDTISRNSRQSGPVRAAGKVRPLDDRTATVPSSSYYGFLAEPDEVGRPAKRQRRNQEVTSDTAVNLIDDEDMEHQMSPTGTSPSAQRTSRLSSTSSQQSVRAKKSKGTGHKVDEYRDVERLMSAGQRSSSPQDYFHRRPVIIEDDQDTQPKQKTKSRDIQPNADRTEIGKPHRDQKPEIFESVEIRNPAGQKDATKQESPSLRKQFFSVDNERRVSNTRESPDELQGDITVQRAPSSLHGVHAKDASVGSPSAERSKKDTHRLPSPSDIRPTVFTSAPGQSQGKANRKAGRAEKSVSHKQLFEIDLFRFGPVERVSSEGQTFELTIDNVRDTLCLAEGAEKDSARGVDISLQKIMNVLEGESPSRKVRLRLSKMEGADEKVDIQLSSEKEKNTFCNALKQKHIKLLLKQSAWMDNAFDMNEKNAALQMNRYKRPNAESSEEPIQQQKVEATKRPKLSDSLQDDSANISRSSGSMISRPPRRLGEHPSHQRNQADSPDPESHSHPSRSGSDKGVSIPVKKYMPNPLYERETRSKSRQMLPTVISDDKESAGENPLSDYKPRKWSRSLVYPRVGKKKAEVDAYDLERLRDGEFLNDNLIGFYLRFLEHHLERTSPETAKKIYFFNSYFFETLTNLPRGKRGINYEGVQKWTRNVDIFSYDYVVVPINENAHWYVAIICNLPSLQHTTESSQEFEGFPDDEVSTLAKTEERLEIPETPPAVAENGLVMESKTVGDAQSDSGKEEKTRQSFASMTLSDKEEVSSPARGDGPLGTAPDADDEWPEEEENPTSSPPKFTTPPRVSEPSKEPDNISQHQSQAAQKGKRPKKKQGRSLPKYDPKKPVIITFDSLDLPRSPTVRCLREYLYEEGKSKRGIDIDVKTIKGMTAREIPLQPNFSDCGLYLLAYMEKFVQDPDAFVSKLLQRDMKTETDWPSLRSGLLRRRLRKFLDDLYEEQEQIKRHKTTEENAMADRKPISYLLGPSEAIEKADSSDKTARKLEGITQRSNDHGSTKDLSGSSGSPSEELVLRQSKCDSAQQILMKDMPKQAASEQNAPKEKLCSKEDKAQETTISSSVHKVSEGMTTDGRPSTNAMIPARASSDQEVIEVLDSQSQRAPLSPRGPRDSKVKDKPEIRNREEMSDDNFLDQLEKVVNISPKVRVEVQVPGTPPSSGAPRLVEDSPRRSPRQGRPRSKGKEG